jgi:hypothetical protein
MTTTADTDVDQAVDQAGSHHDIPAGNRYRLGRYLVENAPHVTLADDTHRPIARQENRR